MQAPQETPAITKHPARLPDKRLLAQDLASLRTAAAIPGMAVDVAVGQARLGLAIGKPSVAAATALNAGSRFRITCAIKLFVALTALRLIHGGVLSLDAPIGTYLPELGTARDSKGGSITIGHLLSHTSGYRGLNMADISIWTEWSWEDCVAFLRSTPQSFQSGSVFNEEHLDHAIVGRVVRKLTGRTMMSLVDEMIFRPLGMATGTVTGDHPDVRVDGHTFSAASKSLEKTAAFHPPNELWSPSFSEITMTVHDMGTLAQTLASDTVTAKLGLGRQDLAALFCPMVSLPSMTSVRLSPNWAPIAFSSACAIFANHCHGYFGTGRGQSCAFVFDPDRRISMAVALNVEPAPLRILALEILFAQLFGLPPIDLRSGIRPTPVDCDFDEFFAPFKVTELAGGYVGNTRETVWISVDQRQMTLTLGSKTVMVAKAGRANRLVIETRWPVPVAVFAEPASGEPALMLGMHAYRKTA